MSSLAFPDGDMSGRRLQLVSDRENRGQYSDARTQKNRQTSGRQVPDLAFFFKWLILFLCIILLGELVFHLVISPRLVITSIEVHGAAGIGLSDKEFLDIAGVSQDTGYFTVDIEKIRSNIEAIPLVKAAEVSKALPGTVVISVTQRAPLAMMLAAQDGKTVPVVIDEQGVVFQVGASVTDYSLPVVSGLTIPEIYLGLTMPEELRNYLVMLNRLKEHNEVLFQMISEIEFVKRSQGGFEVVLYPAHYSTPVRMGSEINKEMIEQVLLLVDVAKRLGLTEVLDEIDMRSGTPVNRYKDGGAHAGG